MYEVYLPITVYVASLVLFPNWGHFDWRKLGFGLRPLSRGRTTNPAPTPRSGGGLGSPQWQTLHESFLCALASRDGQPQWLPQPGRERRNGSKSVRHWT